jgi:hypothetical protein
MTPLRQRMQEDLRLRNFSERTNRQSHQRRNAWSSPQSLDELAVFRIGYVRMVESIRAERNNRRGFEQRGLACSP